MIDVTTLWSEIGGSALFAPALTLSAYEAALALQRRSGGSVLLNPVLLAAGLVIAVLVATGMPYAEYHANASLITVLLGPATVALAVPLYTHARQFRHMALPLLLASAIGAATACLSAIGLAAWLGAPDAVLPSIAPKSSTMAIAIGVSQQIGGQPALTAALVVSTGMLVAVIAGRVLDLAGVRDRRLRGLAIGVAGHGIGTAYAMSVDAETGAFAALGMSLGGLLTGLLLPLAWPVLAH
ncbi:MAG: LrgB family protein [Acetobacteraceae bacterium]